MSDLKFPRLDFSDATKFRIAPDRVEAAITAARDNGRDEIFFTDGRDTYVASRPTGRSPERGLPPVAMQGVFDERLVQVVATDLEHLTTQPAQVQGRQRVDQATRTTATLGLFGTAMGASIAGMVSTFGVSSAIAVGLLGGVVTLIAVVVTGIVVEGRVQKDLKATAPPEDLRFSAYRRRFELEA